MVILWKGSQEQLETDAAWLAFSDRLHLSAPPAGAMASANVLSSFYRDALSSLPTSESSRAIALRPGNGSASLGLAEVIDAAVESVRDHIDQHARPRRLDVVVFVVRPDEEKQLLKALQSYFPHLA